MVLLCSVSISSAQTIYFIDPGFGSDSNTELLIYSANGSLLGVLTTNDSITVDPTTDLILHKRNKKMSIVDDPINFLGWIIDTMGYAIIIIVAGVIIGVGILGVIIEAVKGHMGRRSGSHDNAWGKRKW